MESATVESLKDLATPKNRRAMWELERRGYRFCVEFGYENAHQVLRDIERKVAADRLERESEGWL